MLAKQLFKRIPQARQLGQFGTAAAAAAKSEFAASTLANGVQLVSKESNSNV